MKFPDSSTAITIRKAYTLRPPVSCRIYEAMVADGSPENVMQEMLGNSPCGLYYT